MARSPYYPRRRPRVQPRQSKPTPKDNGESVEVCLGQCALCHADVSVAIIGFLSFMQIPLACVGSALAPAVCAVESYMEDGANT